MARARITVGTYVELDVLLDTRMTIYSDMNSEAALIALTDGSYHKRMSDHFAGIDHAEFMERWKNRDETILRRSTMTNAVLLIRHLSAQWIDESIRTDLPKSFVITVNTFPYRLNDEESEALVKVLQMRWPAPTTVELIHKSRSEILPMYCKEHFETMFMYDYFTWLEEHTTALEKVRIPEISLMAPALWFGKVPTDAELAEIMKEGAHPMKSTQMVASPMIHLELIDAKYFSIVGNLSDNPA